MSDNIRGPIASPAERVAMGKEAQRSEGVFHRQVETTDTELVPTWEIIQGDALKLLGDFSPGSFDAVITDPPYASGGRTQGEKNKSTIKKYSSMGDAAPPPFEGDAKDQRSWTRWAGWIWRGTAVLAAVLEGYSATPASRSPTSTQGSPGSGSSGSWPRPGRRLYDMISSFPRPRLSTLP